MTGGPVASVAAIDLGASSGRVVLARFNTRGLDRPGGVELTDVSRFPNQPVRVSGRLHWDVLALFRGMIDGLLDAERTFGYLDGVGVDGWAVDYGLLDADGQLLGNPRSYRQPDTDDAVDRVRQSLGEASFFAATGITLRPFNTIFQLLARRGSPQQQLARHALLIPDLMSYWLSGELGTEVTNASTTGLLSAATRDWAAGTNERLGAPVHLFPGLRAPGTRLGPMLASHGLARQPAVITVPSHDTAAAVAGIPAADEEVAFVCTGTWALVGVQLTQPCMTEPARLAGFTNELGVDGTVRFLRNVTGFWLLQECLRRWQAEGLRVDVGQLTGAAAEVTGSRPVIDVESPLLAASGDMPGLVRAAAEQVDGSSLDTPAAVVRCILDSVAAAIGCAVREAIALSGNTVRVVHLVGGGVATPLFCQLVADACQLPVEAGPVEAAAWGNAVFQARALGIVSESLHDNRALIRLHAPPVRYEARVTGRLVPAGRL